MNVSIGVMAYNEERNISKLLDSLLKQKTNTANIKEIIVVSSGSTDKTNEIVNNFSKKNKKIKLIVEEERRGKSSAINIFLKKAKSNILILESADTIPKENTIEILCSKFHDKIMGVVGGKSIPVKNKNKLINFIVQLQWQLHHELSKNNPKFGELIAFRKIMKQIPKTIVDEEEIASIIKKKKLKLIYEPNAIVYNKGPETIKDFIRQRRRIYCGHLELRKRKQYNASSLNSIKIFKILLQLKVFRKNILFSIIAITLEGFGRVLGCMDNYFKKNHAVWRVSESTKKF
ncbi:glycosyltransferase [Candidatus Woesearchaeota archaeon]|nr:glycosyltransferase [Candidatus Woesearchaeota archaeon]